jgi:hypothetical protein
LGFDWEYVSEKRYRPKWGNAAADTEPLASAEVALESTGEIGRDSMRIEGFSYVSPFGEDTGDPRILLDMELLEEYENMAQDLTECSREKIPE